MSGIGIITNPHSKLNKQKPHRTALLGYILGEHGRIELTESLSELESVARKFKESSVEILAINGGDGTISRTLTAFVKVYGQQLLPKIALLRGGTMNVLASNLGLKGTSASILYRIIEAYSTETPMTTITLASLEIEDHIGFLFADGIGFNILKKFYKHKSNALGALWLVLRISCSTLWRGQLFRELIVSRPISLEPEPGPKLSHDSLMVMASTIQRIPFRFKLFPKAGSGLTSGLQFLSIYCKPEDILWYLPRYLFNRREGYSKSMVNFVCERLSIYYNENYTYTVDGELFTAKSNPIQIRSGPKFEFIVV